MRPLEEVVALVTRAASGIGRAIAQRYAGSGARVVVSDMDEDGGQETVRLVEARVRFRPGPFRLPCAPSPLLFSFAP